MKRLVTFGMGCLLILLYAEVYGQGVLITDDASTTPDASAILEVKSTTKGFLPPKVTVTEMEAINTPQAGMLVYNTSQKIPMVYNGTDWVDLKGGSLYSNLEVGDYYQGGIVFYLDGSGGGWISAQTDLDDGGNNDFTFGCTGTEVGASSQSDGDANTAAILGGCAETTNGAYLTDGFSNDGYSDWFIPAPAQLDSMYVYRTEIGGFTTDVYWSSSEASGIAAPNGAMVKWFNNGTNFPNVSKDLTYRVRPMRSF